MISIIVAVSDDWGIGKDNKLLWHIPEDMRRFKKLTMGKSVIMGKKTWESLPKRPLPGRKNIVLTDIPDENIDCSVTAYSIEDALSKCDRDEEVFVIGGGSIYHQFMEVADRLYITHVHRKAPADVWFPKINRRKWRVVEEEECISEDEKKIPYSYVIYEKRGEGK
ncbi:MAG: dihydrofolate reductase [Bacteroidia bacterium]|nr:dihydrofolate reductase [Bacteroidia bacterium]